MEDKNMPVIPEDQPVELPETFPESFDSGKNHPVIDETGKCYDEVRKKTIYSCMLSEDLKSISGYTDDGTKARYYFDRGEWLYGAEIRMANLIPLTQRSKEEATAIRQKGAQAVHDKHKEAETMNDIAKRMLSVDMSEDVIDEILGKAKELLGEDKSASAVIIARMIQEACAGSFKAAEFVRDTAGYRPRTEMQIDADIITEEDRNLIDKLNKRLIG